SIHYSSVVTKLGPCIELVISGKSQESNKVIFDLLKHEQAKIEEAFGKQLIWERLDDIKQSKIKYEIGNLNFYNKDDWDTMIQFFVEFLPKFEEDFEPHIEGIKQKIKVLR